MRKKYDVNSSRIATCFLKIEYSWRWVGVSYLLFDIGKTWTSWRSCNVNIFKRLQVHLRFCSCLLARWLAYWSWNYQGGMKCLKWPPEMVQSFFVFICFDSFHSCISINRQRFSRLYHHYFVLSRQRILSGFLNIFVVFWRQIFGRTCQEIIIKFSFDNLVMTLFLFD